MFGNHGLCGLPEEGAHEKSPKCLDGKLGDLGGMWQRSQIGDGMGYRLLFDDCRRMIGYETGRLKMFSDGLFVWKSKKSGLFVGCFGDGGTGVADGGFGCRCFHAAFLAYFGNHFVHFVH